jgi:3-hydroxyisobutyrate dehydrogenase
MGRGMSLNLVAHSGTDVIVYDILPDAADPLRAAGATVADDVGDLVRRCDVVFTSLPGPVQVEEIAYGPDGLLANARPGQVVFDLSTSSLSLARRIHESLAKQGATLLDAPVSGGPAGAASGDLVIWVGGSRDVYDAHLPLLSSFSSPAYVGEFGAGTITKLAHNMSGYMIMLSLAETFSVAVKAGADPLELWKAMRLGLVGKGSPMDMLVKQFLPGVYEPPAFALKLAHKDVRLATELARELGVPMRLANLTLEEMTEALARGFGDQDSRAYLKLQLERAGVEIAVDPEAIRLAVEQARS